MASFPTLQSGKVTMLPAVREKRHGTEVVRFVNDTEQRWKRHVALSSFELRFRDIDGYDLGNILDFYRSMKGRFDSTWDLTLAAVTYQYMVFDQDELAWTEAKPDRFSLTVRCKQVRQN